MFKKEIEILKRTAAANGLYLNEEQLSNFRQYYYLLLEGNKKCNLTAIIEPAEVVIKHYYDSLTCLMALDITRDALVVDVGTGAGFPGLPMKIGRADIQLTLLDSLGKRVEFLKSVVASMGLEGVEVINGRAEDYGRSTGREKYDLAVSRAVADLRVLAELCLPLVRIGGIMVAMKGPDVSNEVEGAREAIKLLGGGGEIRVIEVELPHLDERRSIIVIEKTHPTQERYPRRAGIPTKRPL